MKSRLYSGLLAVLAASTLLLQAQTPPTIVSVDPPEGPVAGFTFLTVTFSEAVTNVDPSDLLIDGAAISIDFLADGNSYTFYFEPVKPGGGTVNVTWTPGHGIADLEGQPFDGNSETAQLVYTVIDTVAPQHVFTSPAPMSVTNVTQVTVGFSEAVVGVDRFDLLMNGVAALSVAGGPTQYTFTFPPPDVNSGYAFLEWSITNNIADLSANVFPPSAFWFYFLPDTAPPRLTELRPSSFLPPFTEVRATFSESVTNVDSSDLLLNGTAAVGVTKITNAVYVFRFNRTALGNARLEWAGENGIVDENNNAFSGGAIDFANARAFTIFPDTNSGNTFITYSNRFFEGVCTVDSREGRKWVPIQNFFVTQRIAQVSIKLPTNNYTQLRLRSLSVMPGNAFKNLPRAYGNLSTVAGNLVVSGPWRPEWEGNPATDVALADPCCAVADAAGNIYVAERRGHAIDKISPNGNITTFIGQRIAGLVVSNDLGAVGPTVLLNTPSALTIVDSTLYILDAGNGRVRRVNLNDPTAMVTTVFTDPNGIGTNAHGLAVDHNRLGIADDVWYGVGNTLRYWDGTVTNLATGFGQLNFVGLAPNNDLIVADSLNHRIYEVNDNNGNWGEGTVLAGTGFPNGNSVGGDADEVALSGASYVAHLPIGGYFIGLDQGARVWYVDSDDNAFPFIFGAPGAHDGDGEWFRKGGGRRPKISNVKSVHVAPSGDIIMVENGLVRKVRFLRGK